MRFQFIVGACFGIVLLASSALPQQLPAGVDTQKQRRGGLDPTRPFELLVSESPDRSFAVPLEGDVLAGAVYIFIDTTTSLQEPDGVAGARGTNALPPVQLVTFWLDDRTFRGPFSVESLPPYDFAGTERNGDAKPFSTTSLIDGQHTITAQVQFDNGTSRWVAATFTTQGGTPPGTAHELMLSYTPDRMFPVPLEAQNVAGDIYVFVSPDVDVSTASFWVDDSGLVGPPFQVEGNAPFDLAGTAGNGAANPFDTTLLTEGLHTVSTRLDLGGGVFETVHADFTVGNTLPALTFSMPSVSLMIQPGELFSTTVTLDTNDATPAIFSISEDGGWLEVSPLSGTTPETLFLDVDGTSLPTGTYVATVTATAAGYFPGTLNVVLEVDPMGGCSPLPCGEILVDLPYELDFESDHGKILDGGSVGTGFTYLDPPTSGTGLVPSLLAVDTNAGVLDVTTTAGIMIGVTNTQDNALGVGIDAPSQVSILKTTLVDPPLGTGSWEQAGLWFGNDEDNYVKNVFASTPGGTQVQFLLEVDGIQTTELFSPFFVPTGQTVELVLKVDPFSVSISAEYGIDGGPLMPLGTVFPPPEFFSFDAAGINLLIGTRSFGGIFATHRSGPASLVYTFDDFSVTEGPSIAATGDIDFLKTSFPMVKPTAMAWGPDDRLYVVNVFGEVRAFTLDGDNQVVNEEIITSLTDDLGEARLALGIAIDPLSTPSDVTLYVGHSNVNQGAGVINSGMVSRLSGASFDTVDHIITGLPRALADHSVNALHFGADMRLYIAVGGITGAGAPNLANTEFGTREEQPLSAAIIVADIFAPGFDGTCANDVDPTGRAPCDVVPWITGLRNVYDFAFHSNGETYGADNGLGVTGTFPPVPTDPCFGFGDPALVIDGGHNPGPQPDPLLRLVPGMYYGHPNPSRGECVFGDGTLQSVAAPVNYMAPMFDLGEHRSANGIVEYPFDVGCVQMGGDLLIANFSTGDDITRIKLTQDGLSVFDSASLIGGFDDPLPLLVAPDGTIFVGEFGGDVVTALRPQSLGCWNGLTPAPAPVLDANGAELDGDLYMVGGKTSSAHVSSVYVYDPDTDTWNPSLDKPGPALEDIAVTSYNGQLWVFGGAPAPFTGAVDEVRRYDPGVDNWRTKAPMGTARSGATAQEIGGLVYVVGGMDVNGHSLSSGEVYDPVADSWTPIASMMTRRDNAGSAVLGGKLYVFGGRTRNSDGTTIDGRLASVEMYDPATDTWTPKAFMPTGRRRMVVGTMNGRAQLIGGENTDSGGAFSANEEYDPVTDTWRTLQKMVTPRQGAAGATIGSFTYVAAGGIVAGAGWTDVTESFGF